MVLSPSLFTTRPPIGFNSQRFSTSSFYNHPKILIVNSKKLVNPNKFDINT